MKPVALLALLPSLVAAADPEPFYTFLVYEFNPFGDLPALAGALALERPIYGGECPEFIPLTNDDEFSAAQAPVARVEAAPEGNDEYDVTEFAFKDGTFGSWGESSLVAAIPRCLSRSVCRADNTCISQSFRTRPPKRSGGAASFRVRGSRSLGSTPLPAALSATFATARSLIASASRSWDCGGDRSL
jgi:hypothetical protein